MLLKANRGYVKMTNNIFNENSFGIFIKNVVCHLHVTSEDKRHYEGIPFVVH